MKFKGLTDWFEIFRSGTWTDSAGNTDTYTAEDLDTIVKNYNPADHEAPFVIGHPETEDPAWGWVEDIKREGEVLLAKGKQVVKEFEDMVKQGLFKKRSVRLSPDRSRLLHVGFLGAAAPAVKGLENIAFNKDEEGKVIEFSESDLWAWRSISRIFRNIRDWIIEKDGKEVADSVIPDWNIEDIREKVDDIEDTTAFSNANPKKEVTAMSWKDKLKTVFTKTIDDMPDDGVPEEGSPQKQFSEAEVKEREKAAADKAAKEAKKAAEKEFAENQKQDRIEARKQETKDFVEGLKKDGNLIPAWEKMGLLDFMQSLDGEEVIEFSEEQKTSRLDFFKNFLNELPKVINFNEIATREKDTGDGTAQSKIMDLAKKKAKEDKISFGDAMEAVAKEHPDLYKEYEAETGKKEGK